MTSSSSSLLAASPDFLQQSFANSLFPSRHNPVSLSVFLSSLLSAVFCWEFLYSILWFLGDRLCPRHSWGGLLCHCWLQHTTCRVCRHPVTPHAFAAVHNLPQWPCVSPAPCALTFSLCPPICPVPSHYDKASIAVTMALSDGLTCSLTAKLLLLPLLF